MDDRRRFEDNLLKIENATKNIRTFIDAITDEKSLVEWDVFLAGKDFLDGSDALGEGVLTGYATVEGAPVYIFAQNRDVLKGSFSIAQAKKIEKAVDNAIKAGVPFLSIIDSSGARLAEGTAVLEGYGKLARCAAKLRGAVPHIAVVKGACVGLAAVYAALADIVIVSERDCLLSAGAPMAIAAKSGNVSPAAELFGAKAQLKNGTAALTYKNEAELKTIIAEIFDYLRADGECADDLNRTSSELEKGYEVDATLKAIADGGKYTELYKGWADEIRCALIKIGGRTAAVVASDISKNEGFISLSGIKKIKRFAELAEVFGWALVTLVDSKGLMPSLEEERGGIALEAGLLLDLIANTENTKIAVIAGKAVGFAYLALAGKELGYDYSVALYNASISPIVDEAAIEILYSDEIKAAKDAAAARKKLADAYSEAAANPFVAAKEGFVDNIIEPSMLRPYLASLLSVME
ncbi:MAG: carboxyl transferase domain-containing protein [Christensenellales bacterium]|jgi:acetyl-CoA carboxylase carboxyltransferase component|nr:carboxyl transferase domain-containing protein [Eubacteriales bacterium]